MKTTEIDKLLEPLKAIASDTPAQFKTGATQKICNCVGCQYHIRIAKAALKKFRPENS